MRLTKKVLNGGRVERKGKEFYAYDSQGRFLGWNPNKDVAAFMAANGYVSQVPGMSELSLWVAWNDALASGERPLVDEEGTQYLAMPGRVVMSAKEDEHGYSVELLSMDTWAEMFTADGMDDVFALKYADKPIELL